MGPLKVTRKQRLIGTIAVAMSFFLAELVVGFRTRSLALIADAIHYLNDLIGFAVALIAVIISERSTSPQALSFGWQRASLLGAFFNGVFLLALGVGIVIQAVERFIDIKPIEDPFLVMTMGCIGLTLNVVTITFLHEHDHHGHDHGHDQGHSHGSSHDHSHGHSHGHDHTHEGGISDNADILSGSGSSPMVPLHSHHEHRHTVAKIKSPGRDLGMLGVLIHVIGDAINNIGVIVAAVVIWKTDFTNRFYADPAVSMFIAMMVILTALPLVRSSGQILLQSAPTGMDMNDVRHDIEKIPGIVSVHELHVWRLDQKKAIASVHVVVSDKSVSSFMEKAKTIGECLHAYGIHSVTLQPELALPRDTAETSESTTTDTPGPNLRRRQYQVGGCQMICGSLCESLMCCSSLQLTT